MKKPRKAPDKAATSIDKFGKETKNAGESVDALGSALAAAGIVAALKQMADAMTACVQASIEFESAMTGVEKTTDLTDKELAQMADAFKDLSGVIPMTAAELAAIAENAGQLGIEKDNIALFFKLCVPSCSRQLLWLLRLIPRRVQCHHQTIIQALPMPPLMLKLPLQQMLFRLLLYKCQFKRLPAFAPTGDNVIYHRRHPIVTAS